MIGLVKAPQLNFNSLLGVGVVLSLLLSFVLGEYRIKRLAIGSFAGFIIADKLATTVLGYLQKQSWGRGVELGIVQIVLFCGVIIAMMVGHGDEAGRGKGGLKVMVLALLTMLFVVASVIGFLPAGNRESLITDYNLASMIYGWHYVWLLASAGWLALLNYLPKPDKKK